MGQILHWVVVWNLMANTAPPVQVAAPVIDQHVETFIGPTAQEYCNFERAKLMGLASYHEITVSVSNCDPYRYGAAVVK